MNVGCSAIPCPIILDCSCVHYSGANLIYTGIVTNDNFCAALQKIDAKFRDAGLGYIFQNGITQAAPGQPVKLGGNLIEPTLIANSGYPLTVSNILNAGAHVTIGGTSSDFVKGDGSLDSNTYQVAGNYITDLTGDGTASGPGSAAFTLASVNPTFGTWGSSTQIPVITTDVKGRITNITTTAVSVPSGILSFTGDVTGSGVTGSTTTLTLATVNSNVYTANTPLIFAVNAKGLVTSAAPFTNLTIQSILGYIPVPQTRNITINGVTQNLTADRTWTIPVGTGTVTGTGIATQVAFWDSGTSISGDNGLWWDNTSKYLGVGTNTPIYPLHVNGAGYINGDLTISSPNYLNLSYVKLGGSVNAFGLDYAIFQATTANTGLAIVAKPNGNPPGYGYDFQFLANQAQNSLLFVGDNATQAHYIHTDAYSTGAGWPLIFGVAAAGQQWLTSSNLLVLTPGQNVGIGTTTPSYKLDVNGTFHTVGQNTLTDLAGTGTRMVVADLNGVLSTQAIPGGGGGITSLNGLSAATQTFVNDTNVTIVSSGTTHTITWAGTLADSRIASAATWNAKQDAITLTTTGTSGAATFIGNTLNIPSYAQNLQQTLNIGNTAVDTSILTSDSAGYSTIIQVSNATNAVLSRMSGYYMGVQKIGSDNYIYSQMSGTTPLLIVHNGTANREFVARPSYIQFKDLSGGGPIISLNAPATINNQTVTLPDGTGVLALKVNGQSANTSGEITIPVGTGTVTGTGTATRVAFWDTSSSLSSDSALYWDNTSKYLGIGTSTPTKALDVTSDAKVNGALLGIGPNSGSSFPNTNIVFGTNALAANTTGYYNAAIGTNAMNANTTGYYNLAIGYDALKVNLISRTNIAIGATSLGKFIGDGTVNGGNTGIGALTLRDNVTGLYNTAIGYGSILSMTGSSFNNAIGYSALRYATSGTYNTTVGTWSGSYYGSAGTSQLTTLNNATFLGYYARPLNNSSTNEIVIGYNSVGNGDNSTTIGNSGTTSTNLFGSLGFGSTPSYGTSGQVLTSNGTGVAPTWTTPSTTSYLKSGTATGTDTYAVTISGVTSYTDGDAYIIRFTNGNTTGCTLNISGVGAKDLYRNNDGALIGGDIQDGGEMICIYDATSDVFRTIGTSPNSLIAYVTNDDSVTITKGQPVYAFSGTGDRMTVKLAYNTSDSTSAQTMGLVLSTSIAANAKGFIIMQGLIDGLSNVKPVNGWSDGSPVYLGSTAGTITPTKPYAPNHLVYLGFVTTASPGAAGRVYVKVQNGYELDELHNVQAQSPTYKDTLWYDNTVSPAQWKTASIATILGYTPQAQLNGTGFVKASGTTISYDNSTYLTAAITSLGGLTGATQTFGNDTNVTMVSSGTTHTLTWSGTLADARIASASTWNAKVGGSGTTSYLPKFTAASTIGDSAFYDGGSGNGGYNLGSVTPFSNAFSTTGSSGIVKMTSDYVAGTTGTYIQISTVANTGNTTGQISVRQNGGSLSSGNLALNPSSGNTLVGTTTASASNAKLQVSGTISQTGSTSSMLKTDGDGKLVSATANTDYLTPPAGTAIQKANSGGALADAVADTDYMQQADVLTAYQLMGSSIKGVNLVAPNPMMLTSSGTNLTSGALQITAIFIQKTVTITGVRWYQHTNGNYTANNYNGVGLYTQSGGTLTLVASSTNDGTIWQSGGGWRNKAFSSTYTASRGVYYVAALYSSSAQTTAPGVAGTQTSAGVWATLATVDFTNNERAYAGVAGQTALTTPVALSTFNTGNNIRIGLYLY